MLVLHILKSQCFDRIRIQNRLIEFACVCECDNELLQLV